MYNTIMSDKDPPNDDDFFRKSMHGVKPLDQDTHKRPKSQIKIKKKSQPTEKFNDNPVYEYDYNIMNQERWVDGDTKASFSRSGLQPKTIAKLKSGKLRPEARLDLHHYTAGEAMGLVDQFLDECVAEQIRCLLIIHGKGYMGSHNKPILKNILIEHLHNNSYVLAYQSAQPRDGGTGALYVLLKEGRKVL
ncbi:MAG: hypothetical protein COB66_03315 [Coxiella sp. (in: Bacteria)]|nr:MAG: hypothetical protein COB66_03315 [Coxiella sp. (in: g-proteobacteria)]